MADVFISYKRAERERVGRINELLRAEGLAVWFDARLEVGRGEGFDAEIEREVTSAACVLVCWTHEAIGSIYVKGEAKKGLERQVLVPVFLEPCTLPVPFNAVDTADLIGWSGDSSDSRWQAVLETVKRAVEKSKADEKQRTAHSLAAYERVTDKIYPGTLRLLIARIAARSDVDAWIYYDDICALLEWLESVTQKAVQRSAWWYEIADRHSGGSEWYAWERGEAAADSAKLSEIRKSLKRIDDAIVASQGYLDRPSP